MEPSSLELAHYGGIDRGAGAAEDVSGVVVHSREELKQSLWDEEQTFKVHFNSNLDVRQTGRLLDTVAEYIERNYHSDAH